MGRSTPFGVRGAGGALEKEVVLRIAGRIAHHLGQGAVLTRSGDVNLSLAERAAIARRMGARVFVSLHVHAEPDCGTGTYVHPRAGEASRGLARRIHAALARHGGQERVRDAEMAVLSPAHHAATTAACLVELDALAGREQPDGRAIDRMGRAIAGAIAEHLRVGGEDDDEDGDDEEEEAAAVTAPRSSDAAIRRSIVDLARSFVAEKAHYLWGTAGNTPGHADGNPGGGKRASATLRAFSLDKTSTDIGKALGVCMAYQSTFDRHNSCAGRSTTIEKEAVVREADLDQYVVYCQIEADSGVPQERWSGAGSVGGRAIHARRVHFRGAPKDGGKLVWGESCVGVRHFDCVGLVNYCYAQHYYNQKKLPFGLDIPAFRNPSSGFAARSSTAESDFMDADVVVTKSDGHIGMIYWDGAKWRVVQAVGTDVGLTESSEFKPHEWDRFRMAGAYLVP